MPKPSEQRSSAIVWIIALGLVAAVAWSAVYKIDEATHATGSVIATSRVQVIQSVDGGVLDTLNVREGDRVQAGQVIATLDQTRISAAVQELEAKTSGLQAQSVRLRAEILGASELKFGPEFARIPGIVSVQRSLFQQKQRAIAEELRTLEVAVKLADEELRIFKALAADGDMSRADVLRSERAVNDAQAQLANRRNRYLQEVQAELAKAEDDLAQAQQVQAQRARALEDSVFRAHLAGTVKNVRVTTIGGVLRPGDELMQIVPSDDVLIVEAKVRPADIALVLAGLPATIRFDAYDYTLFGTVAGTVTHVGADTLKEDSRTGEQTYYRVHVAVSRQPVVTQTGRKLDILPGMTAQIDIRTGERTVLHYLLKPVRRTISESFRER